VIFKKIDSLMRGKSRAEIDAALEAFGCDEASSRGFSGHGAPRSQRPSVGRYCRIGTLDVSAIARNAASDEDLRRLVAQASLQAAALCVRRLAVPWRRTPWPGSTTGSPHEPTRGRCIVPTTGDAGPEAFSYAWPLVLASAEHNLKPV